jgi:hypothetical protein
MIFSKSMKLQAGQLKKGRIGMIRALIAFVIGFVVAALLGSHVYLGDGGHVRLPVGGQKAPG